MKRIPTLLPQRKRRQKRRINIPTLILIFIAISLVTLHRLKNTLHHHYLHHDTTYLSQQQPVAPLPLSSAPYTHRKTSHLSLSYQTIQLPNLPNTSFTYLNNKQLSKIEGLYDFSNYVGQGFEGSVTHTWVSILHHTPLKKNDIVIDGGFNTGFYTTLTAAGFNRTVHSFDVQLDCFDVARRILAANGIAANERAHLYHFGLSGRKNGVVPDVTEGCDPGFSIAAAERGVNNTKRSGSRWEKKKHAVMLTSLDNFIDELSATTIVGDVVLVKLDIEGGEISALQRGFVRHRHLARNIIMEYSLRYTQQMENRPKIDVRARSIRLFRELTRDGLLPYLLFHRRVAHDGNSSRWIDETYLATVGLKRVSKHPVSLEPVGPERKTMLWGVDDFGVLLDTVCSIGCNLYFSRGR